MWVFTEGLETLTAELQIVYSTETNGNDRNVEYSWPLYNMGVHCVGSLTHRLFSVNACLLSDLWFSLWVLRAKYMPWSTVFYMGGLSIHGFEYLHKFLETISPDTEGKLSSWVVKSHTWIFDCGSWGAGSSAPNPCIVEGANVFHKFSCIFYLSCFNY